MTGNINMGGHSITNLSSTAPTQTTDVVNKGYVDGKFVSNVAYDSTNKKITKTVNGTTSDVVTVATLKSDMNLTKSDVGLGNVTNESKATMFTSPNFTGTPTVNNVNVATINDVNAVNPIVVVTTSAFPSNPSTNKLYIKVMTATSGNTTYTEYVPYIYYNSTWVPLSAIW